MSTILPSATTLPTSFAWHQSSAALMLRCPRRFYFKFVLRFPVDHVASNYAHLLGTADHAGIELILKRSNEGKAPTRAELLDHVLDAFEKALHKAQDKGEHTDPDGLPRAVDRIEGERIERLLALADDDRVHAVEWGGIEWPFKFAERGGRKWQGTIDAWGVARRDVTLFGAMGKDPVELERGDGVLCDWKTGEAPPFGWVERILALQLGIYAMALNRSYRGSWRTFLGVIQDLDRPKSPRDENGIQIPKRLPKELNPAFREALKLDHEAALKSKKRPRDGEGQPITKWLPEQINPEWESAIARPKGPLFREARISYPLVLDTIRAAITQAELGLFPASGALTGQCSQCPYQTPCTRREGYEHDD